MNRPLTIEEANEQISQELPSYIFIADKDHIVVDGQFTIKELKQLLDIIKNIK